MSVVKKMNEQYFEIGKVVSVSGNSITVQLSDSVKSDMPIINGVVYRIGQIGSFLKIPLGYCNVIGIVTQIGAAATPENVLEKQLSFGYDSVSNSQWLAINLIGEQTGKQFNRGVSQSPTTGDSVCLVTIEDLSNIYNDYDASSSINVGNISSSESLNAYMNLDKVVSRHIAVLGSTGSGKSNAVGVILNAIIEKQFKNARILVLDPHGEYNTVFKRSSSVYKIGGDYTTSKQLYVPYWALPFNELISLFDAPITDANREYIREKIVHAKVKGAEVNGIKIDSVLISADSPIPFSIKKLWFDLDDFERQTFNKRGDPDSKTELVEKGDPDRLKSNIYQPASTTNSPPFTNNQAKGLLSFLESIRLKLTDTRYNFLFSPGEYTPDKEGKIQKDIGELLSDWFDSQKAISIFDLSNVPAELMLSITGTLLNIVYDALFWGQNLSNGGKRRPLLIVLEEAHNYLHNGKASIASRTVQRIAREGRKYGIGLMLVTQRPSELDETVLSQCGTIVALRMNNNKDRAYVSGAIQDELRSLIDLLPSMRTGEAIISGEGVKIPSRVQFFRLNGAYKGSDPAVSELWRNAPENENSYAELVKLWRNKKFTLEENESE